MERVLAYYSECTLALVSPPLECSMCHESTSCLVNRDGRTRCYDCDAAYQDRKAAARKAAGAA